MSRKLDHLRLCADPKKVGFREKTTLLEDVELIHNALPQVSLDDVDTSCKLLGKHLAAPIIIEAITRGIPQAEKLNQTLAAAAERYGIGFGVGSQRKALENKKLAKTYQVRDVAPDILLIGNIGLVQFSSGMKLSAVADAASMIGADAIALHLNPVHEAIQPEGDTNFYGTYGKLREIVSLGIPIIAKEVGSGISRKTARMLIEAGVSAIDVAGAGGTSWTRVEYLRSKDTDQTFGEWGIPTAASLLQCTGLGVPVISSGGIRSGLDVAKSIVLGASAAGAAQPFLSAYLKGPKALNALISSWIRDLKIAMMVVGAKNLPELAKTEYLLTGKLKDWASL